MLEICPRERKKNDKNLPAYVCNKSLHHVLMRVLFCVEWGHGNADQLKFTQNNITRQGTSRVSQLASWACNHCFHFGWNFCTQPITEAV